MKTLTSKNLKAAVIYNWP